LRKTWIEKFDSHECEDKGIHAFKFGNEEIVRSKILRFICERLG